MSKIAQVPEADPEDSEILGFSSDFPRKIVAGMEWDYNTGFGMARGIILSVVVATMMSRRGGLRRDARLRNHLFFTLHMTDV